MKWCTLIRDQSLRDPLVFLGLFLIITMMDTIQYTPDIDAWREAQSLVE